ncbi:hypothetical protein GCM10018962_27720 [Dactylosporangium matsuzakiense]|uniref:Uncharacterized protein n=1 Tax=Dactylosporangium matsuzakiense TaxID=53360 RepID=A0A9W6KNG5_9ACTN|nr:hypothetical protein GCM10017581_058720 [Dactylosporangium matsuzakiense]
MSGASLARYFGFIPCAQLRRVRGRNRHGSGSRGAGAHLGITAGAGAAPGERTAQARREGAKAERGAGRDVKVRGAVRAISLGAARCAGAGRGARVGAGRRWG